MVKVFTNKTLTSDDAKRSYYANSSAYRYSARFATFSRRLKVQHRHMFAQRQQLKRYGLSCGFYTDWTSRKGKHLRQFNVVRQRIEEQQKDRERQNEPYRDRDAIDRVRKMANDGRLSKNIKPFLPQ